MGFELRSSRRSAGVAVTSGATSALLLLTFQAVGALESGTGLVIAPLVIASATCSPPLSAIALLIALVPALVVPGSAPVAIAATMITAAIVASRSRFTSPPLSVPVALAVVAVAPLPAPLHLSTVAACGVIVAAHIVSMLLLHPTMWVRLTLRARPITLAHVLSHTTVFFPLLFLTLAGATTSPTDLLVFLVATLLPAALSFGLARWIITKWQELNPALRTSPTAVFSGVAAQFWRRTQEPVTAAITAEIIRSESNVARPASEERHELFSPGKGICAVARDGTVLFLNNLFREFTALGGAETIGRTFEQLPFSPPLRKPLKRLFERTLAAGPRTMEVRVEQNDGAQYLELATVTAEGLNLSTIGDTPGSFIVVIRDVSERRALDPALLDQQRQAARGDLLRGVCHACANLLGVVSAKASLAVSSASEGERQQWQDILAVARQAGNLLRHSDDLSRTGDIDLSATVPVLPFFEERAPLLRELAPRAELTLASTNLDESDKVRGDQALLLQAVSQLVINSAEALPDGKGLIEVSLTAEQIDEEVAEIHPGATAGDFIRLRVRDTGSGMSAETLARAFDPLFSTKGGQHPGLGLAVVYNIVRAHDGFLTVESRLGHGTTVSLYLPRSSQPPQARSQQQEQSARGMQRSGSILVVEDEATLRELITKMLASLGYTVDNCANGLEALDRCQQKGFDLLLVDYMMPKMHGLELVAQLKREGRQLPVLLMTGYGGMVDPETPILYKPFDMATLASAVRGVMSPPTSPSES